MNQAKMLLMAIGALAAGGLGIQAPPEINELEGYGGRSKQLPRKDRNRARYQRKLEDKKKFR